MPHLGQLLSMITTTQAQLQISVGGKESSAVLGKQQGLRPGSKRPRARPRFVCSYKKQFHIFPPEEQSRHHNFHIYVENLYLRHSNSLDAIQVSLSKTQVLMEMTFDEAPFSGPPGDLWSSNWR